MLTEVETNIIASLPGEIILLLTWRKFRSNRCENAPLGVSELNEPPGVGVLISTDISNRSIYTSKNAIQLASPRGRGNEHKRPKPHRHIDYFIINGSMSTVLRAFRNHESMCMHRVLGSINQCVKYI